MPTDNKAIVRRLYEEVWNKRRLEVVDEFISSSHALNDPLASDSQVGPKLYKRRVVEFTNGFPDSRFTNSMLTPPRLRPIPERPIGIGLNLLGSAFSPSVQLQ